LQGLLQPVTAIETSNVSTNSAGPCLGVYLSSM